VKVSKPLSWRPRPVHGKKTRTGRREGMGRALERDGTA